MRQLAWLHTTPKKASQPRSSVHDTKLPSIEGYEHVIAHLERLGVVTSGFDGVDGFSWVDIEAYLKLHCNYVPKWLPGLLHKLSSAYATQARKSREPNCVAPYLLSNSSDTMKAVRANVDKALEDFF